MTALAENIPQFGHKTPFNVRAHGTHDSDIVILSTFISGAATLQWLVPPQPPFQYSGT